MMILSSQPAANFDKSIMAEVGVGSQLGWDVPLGAEFHCQGQQHGPSSWFLAPVDSCLLSDLSLACLQCLSRAVFAAVAGSRDCSSHISQLHLSPSHSLRHYNTHSCHNWIKTLSSVWQCHHPSRQFLFGQSHYPRPNQHFQHSRGDTQLVSVSTAWRQELHTLHR